MQSPTWGTDILSALVQCSDGLTGVQIHWKGLSCPGGQQAKLESAVCSSSKGGQQHHTLCYWEMITPLYLTLTRPCPKHCTWFLSPPVQKQHWQTCVRPLEGYQDGWGLEHVPCEEKLRELGLYRLKKRWLWVYLPVAFQLLQGSCWEDKAKLFTEVHVWRPRDNGLKLWQGRLQVDTNKKLLHIIKNWSWLPEQFV